MACVAIFGMLAMITYPFAAPLLFGNDLTATGVFFGTAIHDTAQVTGAAPLLPAAARRAGCPQHRDGREDHAQP